MSYDNIEFGLSSSENSSNREAANKHIKGSKKYKKMVSDQTAIADRKNLPFKFSGPKKNEHRGVICQCPHCENATSVTKNTIMVICGSCRKGYSVTEDNTLKR